MKLEIISNGTYHEYNRPYMMVRTVLNFKIVLSRPIMEFWQWFELWKSFDRKWFMKLEIMSNGTY